MPRVLESIVSQWAPLVVILLQTIGLVYWFGTAQQLQQDRLQSIAQQVHVLQGAINTLDTSGSRQLPAINEHLRSIDQNLMRLERGIDTNTGLIRQHIERAEQAH
jgi:hypothetical protein